MGRATTPIPVPVPSVATGQQFMAVSTYQTPGVPPAGVGSGMVQQVVAPQYAIAGQPLRYMPPIPNSYTGYPQPIPPGAKPHPGKRKVAVKALQAAETSKRLAEKKENERNMKKEALKIARESNKRQREVEKEKLEDKRKQIASDIAAKKKRQREEEEKKEKASKRLRSVTRQKQENNVRVEKVQKEQPPKSQTHNVLKRQPNKNTVAVDESVLKMTEPKLIPSKLMLINGECGQSSYAEKNVKGKSYEISPYKCSDDEEDEIDELPTKKYNPEWGSRDTVVHRLPLQQEMDPNITFPPESFCSVVEVLLPRTSYQKRSAAARTNRGGRGY